jgi:hypothetical protein
VQNSNKTGKFVKKKVRLSDKRPLCGSTIRIDVCEKVPVLFFQLPSFQKSS